MKLQRQKFDASIPSVAMGDIAFLLLIFFVILARAQDDSHLRWDPASSQNVANIANPLASVVIDADGKYYLNGKEISIGGLPIDLAAVLGNRPSGNRNVMFKVDKASTADLFEPAIEAISQAGGELVHILEPEKEK
jgi:biopolymer transport protein ExbD